MRAMAAGSSAMASRWRAIRATSSKVSDLPFRVTMNGSMTSNRSRAKRNQLSNSEFTVESPAGRALLRLLRHEVAPGGFGIHADVEIDQSHLLEGLFSPV